MPDLTTTPTVSIVTSKIYIFNASKKDPIGALEALASVRLHGSPWPIADAHESGSISRSTVPVRTLMRSSIQ